MEGGPVPETVDGDPCRSWNFSDISPRFLEPCPLPLNCRMRLRIPLCWFGGAAREFASRGSCTDSLKVPKRSQRDGDQFGSLHWMLMGLPLLLRRYLGLAHSGLREVPQPANMPPRLGSLVRFPAGSSSRETPLARRNCRGPLERGLLGLLHRFVSRLQGGAHGEGIRPRMSGCSGPLASRVSAREA